MNQETGTVEAGGPNAPQSGGHPRVVVREGLRELAVMVAELTAMETRIESERSERENRSKTEGDKLNWEVDERVRKQRQAMVTEHDAKQRQIADAFSNAEKQAKERHARSVVSARRSAEEQLQSIKKAVQEGEWLADSLLEGAEAAATKQTKQIRDRFARAVALLDERAVAVAEVLEGYGLQHLVLDPPPAATTQPEGLDERHAEELEKQSLERLGGLEESLKSLTLARMFVGLTPYGLGAGLVLAGGVVGQISAGGGPFDLVRAGIGAGVGLALALVALLVLKVAANKQVKRSYAPLRQESEDARAWATTVQRLGQERVDVDLKTARARREEELRLVRERHQPMVDKCQAALKERLTALDEELRTALDSARSRFETDKTDTAEQFRVRQAELEARYGRDARSIEARSQAEQEALKQAYEQARAELAARRQAGIQRVEAAIAVGNTTDGCAPLDWRTFSAKSWSSPTTFPPTVRFGELWGDAAVLGQSLLGRFSVAAMLGFGVGSDGKMGSLMVDFERSGREGALATLRATTARVLASMPAGRVRLTMIDPVGLGQTFAGFMHLADYDEQLTGPRIWTDGEAIDRRMQDLTEHMETVIQKYLRNEYDTIDAYNAQAGELAEPYRFLVVADFPTGWSAEAMRKLSSVLASGARCGVHVLMARDVRVALERRVLEDLRVGMTGVEVAAGEGQGEAPAAAGGVRLKWRDEVFGGFEVVGDAEPSDSVLTELCQAVGEGARRANRVEVDVAAVLPQPGQRWTGSTSEEFRVPVGRSGATRLQYMKLGKGVSQHALLAGKTGSGKSTLLHVLVTASALWYSPDEVEFYLIDFKKGVEFKTYVDGKLPHVKAVAVESDREFGLSVLQRLDAELTRRGEMFRKAGVQDIHSFRSSGGGVLPRVLLVVDEFQEFFSEDDKLAQEAAGLLDRLVRQGRAFGMHVILGSQTIGGSAGLPRATLGQMAVRVALQTSEADSALILGDGNTAARLLTRPGEAIYNDNGGLPEANSPFQVAWLGEERRDRLLAEVVAEGTRLGWTYEAVVFEGNKPAELLLNRDLLRLRASGGERDVALIGEPVAIKPTTRVVLRNQPGANVVLIGQQEEAAMATMQAMVLSLAAAGGGGGAGGVRFVVLEGTVADSGLKGGLTGLESHGAEIIPVEYREAEEAIGRVHTELRRRETEGGGEGEAKLILMVYGLQRYRGLRKSGDDFSFSVSGEEKKLSADKMLAEIVKEGPAVGVHVVVWADTLTAVERVFDRGVMREFDHRVLFQMSANDSSALIDSPAANRLGQFRGLLFSEEQGTLEKFRPFGVVGAAGAPG